VQHLEQDQASHASVFLFFFVSMEIFRKYTPTAPPFLFSTTECRPPGALLNFHKQAEKKRKKRGEGWGRPFETTCSPSFLVPNNGSRGCPTDLPFLKNLSKHCVKEFEFAQILTKKLSGEELGTVQQHFATMNRYSNTSAVTDTLPAQETLDSIRNKTIFVRNSETLVIYKGVLVSEHSRCRVSL
jgi:hypothetical protein